MKIALIIPTYNEAAGIGGVIESLMRVFSAAPQHEWQIVIVDAHSPDGTARVVRDYQGRHGNIHLVVEEGKRGIGAAYSRGFRFAMQELGADAIMSFDGDGQHDPDDVPRLAAELENGFDYVIGSRYIAGGSVPKEWAPHRKILSRFGSLYARLLLELPVYDVTSGLRAMRVRGFAERLPLEQERLISTQYAYIFQFLHEMMRFNARIREIPIEFLLRRNDTSKNTWRDIIESLRVTAILRLRTLRQWRLLRVLAIGAIGFLVQTVIFEALGIRFELMRASTAAIVGGEAAILSNFALNRRFAFRDRVTSGLGQELARFHVVAAGSVFMQWLLVRLTEQFFGFSPAPLRAAYVFGVLLGFAITYTGYYFWVWKQKTAV